MASPRLLVLLLLLLAVSAPVLAQTVISTLEQLDRIRDNPAGSYVLAADIDASPTSDPFSSFYNEGRGWQPIGTSLTAFTGTLDGNGYRIFGLTSIRPAENYVGLFATTGTRAVIKDLRLESFRVEGGSYAGGLAGVLAYSAVTGCSVQGSVQSGYEAGGLAGVSVLSDILYCRAEVVLSQVNVQSGSGGGLLGEAIGGTVDLCFATGGMAALGSGGGLIGKTTNQGSPGTHVCAVTDSYALTNVSGTTVVGGLVGIMEEGSGSITTCYSAGLLAGAGTRGGLVGESNNNQIMNSYWDIESSTVINSSGGTGLTTVEMTDPQSAVNQLVGFNFTRDWALDAIGGGRPILRSNQTPVPIGTFAELERITTDSNYQGRSFILTADIEASPTADPAYNSGRGWEPIFNFTGTFLGEGFTIRNLKVDTTANAGFISSSRGALIHRLHLSRGSIRGGEDCGAMVGNAHSTQIIGCTSNLSVTAAFNAGGIVGSASLTEVADCSASGAVEGYTYAGGLSGLVQEGATSRCSASGSVKADMDEGKAGGLVGGIGICAIVDSHATGTATANSAGGLVSDLQRASATRCWASGAATGAYAGGFARLITWSTVTDCYATGGSSGTLRAGGFLQEGTTDAMETGTTFTNCFATGMVTAPEAGGFAEASTQDIFTSCYWNVESTDQFGSAGGEGRITSDMTCPQNFSFSYPGWDFDRVWTIDTTNNGYPRLLAPQESKTIAIGTLVDLAAIGVSPCLDLSRSYILVADIDAAATAEASYNNGMGWEPIGTTIRPFTGVFDGGGYSISNLAINRPMGSNLGLFGEVSEASLRNIRLSNATLTAAASSGLIVGSISGGTLTNCDAQGTVTVGEEGGGIVGKASGTTIEECSARVIAKGLRNLGGVAGNLLDGTMVKCTSGGSVSGTQSVGALVGTATGNITGCLASGDTNGSLYVGGIAGFFESGTITMSSFVGNVRGDSMVGGVAGYSAGEVTACAARGSVQGTDAVGGLVGGSIRGSVADSYSVATVAGGETGTRVGGLVGYTDSGSISRCFAAGSVSGRSSVGGLAGHMDNSSIANSYARGSVSGTEQYIGGLLGFMGFSTLSDSYSIGAVAGPNAGGLAGSASGMVAGSYWNTETSGQATSSRGAGRTTAEMTFPNATAETYVLWDVTSIWTFGTDRLENNGYPYFQAQPVYTISYQLADTLGSLEGAVDQVKVMGADCTPVTAVPKPGARFVQWSDGLTTATRTDRNIHYDNILSPEFALVATPTPTPTATPAPTPTSIPIEQVLGALLGTSDPGAADRNGDGVVDAADLMP